MPDKMIKRLSRNLNKNSYLRSISIPFCRLLLLAVFCVIPWSLIRFFETLGIKQMLSEINYLLYPLTVGLICLLVFLCTVFLSGSFSEGEKAWYSGRLTRKKLCGKRLRYWFRFKLSFKAMRLNILMFLLKTLWTVAFLSPAMLIISAIIVTATTGGIEFYLFLALSVGAAVLLITGLFFRFIVVQRYFLAPYLLADEPKLRPLQAIKQSKNLLDGHIFRIVRFKLKFIPSFFACIPILPVIYFYPHYKQSCSILAKEICL